MIYTISNSFELLNSYGTKNQYLDKYSGDWFCVDQKYTELIDHLKKGIYLSDIFEFPEVHHDFFYSLLEDGILRPRDQAPKPAKVSENRNQVTLVIIEALSFCNLACSYCFEDVPTKGFKMSSDTAIGIVESISKLNLAHNVTIEFNGGESFTNLAVLKLIVSEINANSKLQKHQLSFGVTTNATFINDEIVDFLKNNWVSVTVSLDGIKEDHDRYRFYKSGKGSFDHVMATLRVFNENNINYNVISVISSAQQVYNTYEFFKSIRIPRYSMAIRRHSDRLPLGNAEYSEIAKAHYKVFKDSLECYVKGDFAPTILDYAVFIKNVIRPQDPDYMCLRTPCGAGKNMITYNTKGDIYACQDLIKEPKFKISSFKDPNPVKTINSNDIVQKLNKRKPGDNHGCETCNWQQFCQGGCYSTSYFESGKDIDKSFVTRTPHCDYFYSTFELLMKDFVDNGKVLLEYASMSKTIGK